ncbi:unnamed protein product [Cunninghamella blakesleeana]
MPKSVSFDSQGIKLAGNLYLPENSESKKHAAIVIAHPFSGVKEQTVGLYAEKLSKLGFITLTFDAAYQGESEGTPRFLEDPYQRVEDIKSAVTYLSTLPEVDAERIGALGICASGGYVPNAAQTDVRIKAAAGVSSACLGRILAEGLNGSNTPEALQQALLDAGKERICEAKGGEPNLSPVIPEDPAVRDTLPDRSLFKEAYDYYRTPRAQHPNAPNKFLSRSIDKLAQYSSFEHIELISPRAVLFIAGSDADTKYFSDQAFEKAKEPKELYIVDGASHFDLYDLPQYVDPAVTKLDSFFTQYLVSV